MQKYDFRVDVCSNRRKHRPFRTLSQGKAVCGLVWKMHPSKRVYRPAKSAEEERRLLEDCIPKSTRDSAKWTYKIFNEWQVGRVNKDASLESCSFTLDMAKRQRFDTNIVNMFAESLNLWLVKFIQDVCKGNGQRYPGRTLYSMVCYLVLSNTVSSG